MKLFKSIFILGLLGYGIIAGLFVMSVVTSDQAMDSAGKLTGLLVIAAAVGGGMLALSGKAKVSDGDAKKQGPQF
jgi:hypothetical protein